MSLATSLRMHPGGGSLDSVPRDVDYVVSPSRV